MADIDTLNNVGYADIDTVNLVADSDIDTINEVTLAPPDSVSLSSYTMGLADGDSDSVTVTSSGPWTAAELSDPDNVIQSHTPNGTTGQSLVVNSEPIIPSGTYYATIRVTVGVATADLVVTVTVP